MNLLWVHLQPQPQPQLMINLIEAEFSTAIELWPASSHTLQAAVFDKCEDGGVEE